ncbi:MAG: AEC family transporter [Clostridia bacterium]|nr:AEC family transporter [Clostridia bacterium]
MSFTSLLSTIATLALLLAAGIITGKLKIVDEVSTAKLSTLIVKLGQPFLIINALIGIEATPENIKSGLLILALGTGIHIFMAILAYLLAKPIRGFDERKLTEFGMLFTNCGFIGFPILESIFGETGLFYGAFYVVSFHIFTWTWGLAILARGRDDIKITPKKALVNFGTIPSLIGIVIFLSGLQLPEFVTDFSGYVASLCTPISMLITGANLSRRGMKSMLTNPSVYLTSVTRLILMPLAVTTALWLVGLPDYMVVFGCVMAAMPTAAVITMFGEMYHISPGCAAELVGSTSLLSVATLMPVIKFAEFLCQHRI